MDEKKPPADILEEIMSRSEKPLPSPVPYPPKFDPPPEDTLQPAPAVEKPPLAKRLLPWLCALLGGAVLAALVLGFQLFSVNARLDTLTASVGEIQTVDELRKENQRLNTDLEETKASQEDLEAQIGHVITYYNETTWRQSRIVVLNWLERFCRQGEWLMAACAVVNCDSLLNPNHPNYTYYNPSAYFFPDVMTERYFQLREEAIEHSELLAVERFYAGPGGEGPYTERVLSFPEHSPYEEASVDAAAQLWQILLAYGQGSTTNAATQLATFCDPNQAPIRAALDGGAFQPDTVELFRQVKDDLIRRGYLEEDEDGTVTAVSFYGEYGSTDLATIPLGKVLLD